MTMQRTKKVKRLPHDPDELNACRAQWAAAAITEFRRHTGTDLEDVVSDLLTDVMHWCGQNNQDFDAELQRARWHYHCETAGSPPAC
jgi:hypothetical protein